jgi:hypothetical protein
MLEMQVPTVDVESKDDKGQVVTKRGPAGFLEFVLQTKVAEVDPAEGTPLESTRPLSASNLANGGTIK